MSITLRKVPSLVPKCWKFFGRGCIIRWGREASYLDMDLVQQHIPVSSDRLYKFHSNVVKENRAVSASQAPAALWKCSPRQSFASSDFSRDRESYCLVWMARWTNKKYPLVQTTRKPCCRGGNYVLSLTASKQARAHIKMKRGLSTCPFCWQEKCSFACHKKVKNTKASAALITGVDLCPLPLQGQALQRTATVMMMSHGGAVPGSSLSLQRLGRGSVSYRVIHTGKMRSPAQISWTGSWLKNAHPALPPPP